MILEIDQRTFTMKHLKKGRKFGRKTGQRKAFMKILANNLVQRGRITTTEARAKELRPFVERLITFGKKQNLHGLRLLLKKLPKDTAYKMYHEIAPRYSERSGGYTRIIKQSAVRKQGGAKKAVIEFVQLIHLHNSHNVFVVSHYTKWLEYNANDAKLYANDANK